MRLSKAVDGFVLARQADGYSHNTIHLFRHHLGQVVTYLRDPELTEVSADDLQRFFAWLRTEYQPQRYSGDEGPLSTASLHNAWCSLRSFWRWAHDEFKVPRPDLSLKHPKAPAIEIAPLTEAEVRALLKAVDVSTIERHAFRGKDRAGWKLELRQAVRNRAILLLLLDTGMRAGELLRLRVQDVNLDTGEVTVKPYGSARKTKGRHVYIASATSKAVWRYIAGREEVRVDDPLFLSQSDKPLDYQTLRTMLRDAGKRAAKYLPSGQPVRANPHRFRHTFAVQFLRNGGDVFTLRRMLGHATLQMVERYLALADSDSQNAHRRASPADRWHL